MLIHNAVLTGSLTLPSILPITGSLIMTGSIGIGTVSPTARLHISGTTGVLLEADGVNGVNALFVSSSGNIGIGTNSPVTKLDVVAGSDATALTLRMRSTDDFSFLQFRNNAGTEVISEIYSNRTAANTGSLIFTTNNGGAATERMRITSGGNIGIGTTNPTESTLGINKRVEIGGSVPGVILRSTNSTAEFCMGTGGDGFIFSAAGAANAATDNIFRFFTGATNSSYTATEKMRITSDGYLRLASNGIQFNGDTAAANSLDDYEEGTYTVAMTSQIGSITLSTDYNTGSYTKIGNRVLFSFRVDVLSVSSPSGQLNISLPFMVSNASPITAYRSVASLFIYDAVSTIISSFVSVIVQNTQNVTVLIGNTTTGSDAASQIKAGTQIHVQGQYVAA